MNGRGVTGRLYQLLIFMRTIKVAHEQRRPRNLLSYWLCWAQRHTCHQGGDELQQNFWTASSNKTKVCYSVTWFFFFIEKFEILLLRVWNSPFTSWIMFLKKMTFCLETVRKRCNFSCHSFLTCPVVSLIHTMKCAVLQVAVRPTTWGLILIESFVYMW